MKKNRTHWKTLTLAVGAVLLTITAGYVDYRLSLVIGLLSIGALFYISRKSRSTRQEAARTDWTMQPPFLFAEQSGAHERIANADEVDGVFELVARDFRKIAELTAQSAAQIGRTAHTIKAENEKVMTAMQEAAERLKQATSGAAQASESLSSIRQSVADTADQVSLASRFSVAPHSKISTSTPFAKVESTMLM